MVPWQELVWIEGEFFLDVAMYELAARDKGLITLKNLGRMDDYVDWDKVKPRSEYIWPRGFMR